MPVDAETAICWSEPMDAISELRTLGDDVNGQA